MADILKTIDLSKAYKDNIAVDKVCMTISKGDIYGFLGRNGAGKTTVLKMIMGQISRSSGSIEVFGETISHNDYKYKSRIGISLSNPDFYPKLTARENLEIHRRSMGVQDRKRITEVLNMVGLYNIENKSVGEFSMGMKQRLGIAKALLNYPEFLILDEPINGLDPVAIGQIREIILKLNKAQNTTVLICSHILSEIEHMATKIGIIHKGVLLEEVLYKELEERNKTYLQLRVNNQKKAAAVLEQKCFINGYKIYEDDIIRIFDGLDQAENINKELINNGVLIKELKVNRNNLEDYFTRLTGGDNNV